MRLCDECVCAHSRGLLRVRGLVCAYAAGRRFPRVISACATARHVTGVNRVPRTVCARWRRCPTVSPRLVLPCPGPSKVPAPVAQQCSLSEPLPAALHGTRAVTRSRCLCGRRGVHPGVVWLWCAGCGCGCSKEGALPSPTVLRHRPLPSRRRRSPRGTTPERLLHSPMQWSRLVGGPLTSAWARCSRRRP